MKNEENESKTYKQKYGDDPEYELRQLLPNQNPRRKRGRISRYSFGSTKRARAILRNTIGKMTHEIGLTYPKVFSTNGKEVKDHLHKFKMQLAYRGIQLFWILEFQERGAPHFHGIIDKEIDKKELKKMWYEIVDSNYRWHLSRGAHIAPIRSLEAYAKYMTDYLTKQEQKVVPSEYRDVGRFWGYSRSLLEPHIIKIIFGTESEINSFKAKHIRPLRRWMDNQRRSWKPKRKKYKHKKEERKYGSYQPGKYLTAINGRKFINELKKYGLDTSLFE